MRQSTAAVQKEGQGSKEASASFLKKRSKKLLSDFGLHRLNRRSHFTDQRGQEILLVFFKKGSAGLLALDGSGQTAAFLLC